MKISCLGLASGNIRYFYSHFILIGNCLRDIVSDSIMLAFLQMAKVFLCFLLQFYFNPTRPQNNSDDSIVFEDHSKLQDRTDTIEVIK